MLFKFYKNDIKLNILCQWKYYLSGACKITCFSDHRKSNGDQGEDDIWASVVPGVCAKFSVCQNTHNCFKDFRSQQSVNCTLKWISS